MNMPDDKALRLDVDLCLPGRSAKIKSEFDLSKVTAVYGKSGSGKSSLLNVIAGFKPKQGAISYGSSIWQNSKCHLQPSLRGIGYAMQDALLFPHMSVIENILFAEHESSMFALDEVLDFLSITEFAYTSVLVLSGGQQQRVALARALLAAKNFLLLDEPLSALDVIGRDRILQVLRDKLHVKNIGALYVSHSLDELAIIADDFFSLDEKQQKVKPLPEALTDECALISQGGNAESVISATFLEFNSQFGISNFQCSSGVFQITGKKDFKASDVVRLRIHAKDVSISLEKPQLSSILNIFSAAIITIKNIEEGKAMVYLQLSGERILASISQKSSQLLELSPGKQVFVQIKAVAIC